LNGIRS